MKWSKWYIGWSEESVQSLHSSTLTLNVLEMCQQIYWQHFGEWSKLFKINLCFERLVHVQTSQRSPACDPTQICSCNYQLSSLFLNQSKTEVQSPEKKPYLDGKLLIGSRYSCRTIWLVIFAITIQGIAGGFAFVPIMPDLIKSLR